jgi:hypothetical protein
VDLAEIQATIVISAVGAVAAIATLVYVVRNGRPHPMLFLQGNEPSSGALVNGQPARAFSLFVENNGASPLRVTVSLQLDDREVGESLDGGRAAHTTTVGVGKQQHWSIAVEDDVLASTDATRLEGRVAFRWLLRGRSLTVPRGGRASY